MRLLIIREFDEYVICKESAKHPLFLADRYTSWRNGRQLDILSKRKELLLRANKKRWWLIRPAIHYTLKLGSNDHVFEVRRINARGNHWRISDGNNVYDIYHHSGTLQSIYKDNVQVAKVERVKTYIDEDMIYIDHDDDENSLLLAGFVLIFTMDAKYHSIVVDTIRVDIIRVDIGYDDPNSDKFDSSWTPRYPR